MDSFGTDTHGAKGMNPTNFGDLITFHLARLTFLVFSEMSPQLSDGLP